MFSLRRVALLILIVASLAGAGIVLPRADSIRQAAAYATPGGAEPSEPLIILLTNVLGAFRGLLVDAVWLRAGQLQVDGKFGELYQLYDWAGKLEPHNEEIWDFTGWNMAYNLVAELPDSEARWQWIQRAITWLRDEGLRYNPRSGKIRERIAWIFYHKIGRDLDLHHYYYKHRWALIMLPVVLTREEQDVEGWAAAPKELQTLLADPDVAKALSGFTDAATRKLDELADKSETETRLLLAFMISMAQDDQPDANSPRNYAALHFTSQFMEALRGPGNATARRKIRNYMTARILRTRFGMDRFDIMVNMERDWGKFEWRLPEPHAMYWALAGAEVDPRVKRQINYERLLMYSLQETMRRGQIAYCGPDPNVPMVTAYDFSKIRPLDQLYQDLMEKYPRTWLRGLGPEPNADSVRDGHVQFLEEAQFELYFAGFTDEALKYHLLLKKMYNKPEPYLELEPDILGRVKKFVDEYATHAKVRGELVDPLINRLCVFLCSNKPHEARRLMTFAKSAWEAYCEFTEANAQGRVRAPRAGLQTFQEVMTEDIRQILLGRTAFPPQLIPVLRAILKIPQDKPLQENFRFDETVVPSVPPSSPPPP